MYKNMKEFGLPLFERGEGSPGHRPRDRAGSGPQQTGITIEGGFGYVNADTTTIDRRLVEPFATERLQKFTHTA